MGAKVAGSGKGDVRNEPRQLRRTACYRRGPEAQAQAQAQARRPDSRIADPKPRAHAADGVANRDAGGSNRAARRAAGAGAQSGPAATAPPRLALCSMVYSWRSSTGSRWQTRRLSTLPSPAVSSTFVVLSAPCSIPWRPREAPAGRAPEQLAVNQQPRKDWQLPRRKQKNMREPEAEAVGRLSAVRGGEHQSARRCGGAWGRGRGRVRCGSASRKTESRWPRGEASPEGAFARTVSPSASAPS